MSGKTSAKAKNAWNAKNYDRVGLMLKKTESPTKEQVLSAADAAGESLNAYIVGAVAQRIERESSPARSPV